MAMIHRLRTQPILWLRVRVRLLEPSPERRQSLPTATDQRPHWVVCF